MNKLKIFLTLCFLTSVECQTVPSLNTFLEWLFNVASTEIENLANNFDFKEVSPEDISFYLYTPNKIIQISPKNLSLIDPSKPTKFLIHGWQSSGSDSFTKNMADNYHKNGNYNFISVDWSEHSKKVYVHSASSTKNIGDILGDFIVELIKNQTDFLDNMHIIGVSLGGHVAGFAGQNVALKTGKRVKRITGLDVAAPMFEVPRKRSADSRLSSDDAELVDVIHTNVGFLGISDAVGTADFYIENGGPIQPGCFDPLNIFESIGCSHGKAFEYFVNSINGKKFEAVSCPNSIEYHLLACNSNTKVTMGENISKNAKGIFYLEVDSALPYSKLGENPLGIKINIPKLRIPFIN